MYFSLLAHRWGHGKIQKMLSYCVKKKITEKHVGHMLSVPGLGFRSTTTLMRIIAIMNYNFFFLKEAFFLIDPPDSYTLWPEASISNFRFSSKFAVDAYYILSAKSTHTEYMQQHLSCKNHQSIEYNNISSDIVLRYRVIDSKSSYKYWPKTWDCVCA